MEPIRTQVLVVGGGPGGYVAAIRAGQLGLDTVLVEGDRLGGTCLIRGCIPSKALIHVAGEFETIARAAASGGRHGIRLSQPPELDFAAAIAWKDGVVDRLEAGVGQLLKRAKVRVVRGWARFTDAKNCSVETDAGAQAISARYVVLATGSVPVALPGLPFGGKVISSTEALALPELPRRLVVVGAGYIGLELGVALRKLGAEVAFVEAAERILPQFDAELSAPVQRWLEQHGVAVHLQARAAGLEGEALLVDAAGGKLRLEADRILVTVGRRPRLDGWGFEQMGVDLKDGFVAIDSRCRTAMRDVWAIGDLTGEPLLAHRASAQGEMVAELIAGRARAFEPAAIAAVCFTEPEIVTVGQAPGADGTEASLFPLRASGRALSMDAGEGFVRIVWRQRDRRVLGIQAVGPHLSELAGEFALAIEMGAVLEDIAGTIHVHPTLGEAFHEAALKGLGHAIHV